MVRGRPIKSPIRQNIVNLLYYLQKGYGYQICKIYLELFPTVTGRSVYYHLRKGLKTKEISVMEVAEEKGIFSWGSSVEKTYYQLGENAVPKEDQRIKDFLAKWKKN